MYQNKGSEIAKTYGMNEKEVMRIWWSILSKADKQFKKDKKIEEAKLVSEVNKKTVEPAYNFYEIDAQKVIDKAGLMTSLLVFYVLYTMWWGYAIFYMFDGMGLSMKKAKVKKEV
jgi:capsid portal protein